MALLWAPMVVASSGTAVQNGNWDDPATWGGRVPVLTATEDIIEIPFPIQVTIPDTLTVTAARGLIRNSGFLIVAGAFDGSRLTIENGGQVNVREGGTFQINGGSLPDEPFVRALMISDGTFDNSGHVRIRAFSDFITSGVLQNFSEFEVGNRGTFENRGEAINLGLFVSKNVASNTRDGFFRNSVFGVMEIVEGFSNGSPAIFSTSFLLNEGLIHVDSQVGVLVNGGGGESIIENYGTIDVDKHLVMNHGDANDVIFNRPGGLISLRFVSTFLTGVLVNDAGGVVLIEDPVGKIDNEAFIDNSGLIENRGEIENHGTIAQRCSGVISMGVYSGRDPVDYCDDLPPVLQLPEDIVAEATSDAGAEVDYEVTATDNLDPFPVVTSRPRSGSLFPLGKRTVLCTAVDYVGNESEDTFCITIVDTTPPDLVLIGEGEIEVVQNGGYTDPGATAQDLVDGDLTSSIQVGNPFDITTAGTYLTTYFVIDAAGNTAETLVRTIVVLSPAEAAEAAVETIESLDAPPSAVRSLVAVARVVHSLLEDPIEPNDAAVCSVIGQVISQARRLGQKGKLSEQGVGSVVEAYRELRISQGCQ